MVASAATEPVRPWAHSSSMVVPRMLLSAELRKTAGEYSLSMITKVRTSAPAKAGVTRTRRTRKKVISQSAPETRAALSSSAPICMIAGATEPKALGRARRPKAMISAAEGALEQGADAEGRVGEGPEEADADDDAGDGLRDQGEVLDGAAEPEGRAPGDHHGEHREDC